MCKVPLLIEPQGKSDRRHYSLCPPNLTENRTWNDFAQGGNFMCRISKNKKKRKRVVIRGEETKKIDETFSKKCLF